MSNVNDLEKEKFGESGGEVGVKVLLIHGDQWKAGVENLAALPLSGNNTGDLRQTLDTGAIYRWSGSAWVNWLAELEGGNTFTGLQTINQSGTGRALNIIHTGNSKAIGITSSNTSEYVIDIQGASLTSGRFINAQGSITSGRGVNIETNGVYTGAGLQFIFVNNTSSTGVASSIRNDGTGIGLFIDQNGNGEALRIDSTATSQTVLESFTSADYTGSGYNSAHRMAIGGVNSTGTNVEMRYEGGTGTNLVLDHNGNGLALIVDSEATSAKAVQIQGTQTSNDVVLIIGEGANTVATGATLRVQATNVGQTAPALRVDHSGTGNLAVFTGTGNFGIGTASPSEELHLVRSNKASVNLIFIENRGDNASHTDTYASGGIAFGMWRDTGKSIGSAIWNERISGAGGLSSIGNIVFGAMGSGSSGLPTERMRISGGTGFVGINEASPDYLLDVNGNIGFTPGASVTPVDNGDVVFQATSNTSFTIKMKGSDGVVRSGSVTLA